jgi:hypothetical protein
MLFMVIERFKDRDAKRIYRRLRQTGRSMPDGLNYIDSWVEPNLDRCFQLMETEDLLLLQRWVAGWSDLMEFEIVPVVPSKETRKIFEELIEAEDTAANPSAR